jgi:hypothetical protein
MLANKKKDTFCNVDLNIFFLAHLHVYNLAWLQNLCALRIITKRI